MTESRHDARLAIVSREALIANLSTLDAQNGFVDVSSDAFGHGLNIVVPICQEIGVARFTVSRESEADSLRRLFPGLSFEIAEIDEARVSRTYGLSAHDGEQFTPVMTLKAEILATKQIEAGAAVSYGYTWRAPRQGWLALSALGYADGFNRAWGNRVTAQHRGASYPAVGRVAMDAHSVFTGDLELSPGDRLTYFGQDADQNIYASALAEAVGCSPLSVTSNFNSRVTRVVR